MNRNLSVVEWEKWKDSEEGRTCARDSASGDYLQNRLWRAFMAGYEASRKESD